MKPSLKEIMAATAAHFGIPVSELMGTSRSQEFSWPRQLAMYLCRHQSCRSYPDIGKFLGDRDHTTILHGTREVERAAEGMEVLSALMAIAAQATAAARVRTERERDLVQELHAGRVFTYMSRPASPPRRVWVPAISVSRGQLRPRVALPSDLTPPSQARKMAARA